MVLTEPIPVQKIYCRGRSTKNQIIAAVQPFFLSSLVDQLKSFRKFSTLQMLQNLFTSYRAIDKFNLEGNAVKVMGSYDPAEALARIIEQSEKGR